MKIKVHNFLLAEAGIGVLGFSQMLAMRDYKDSFFQAMFVIAMSGVIGALAFELLRLIIEDVLEKSKP